WHPDDLAGRLLLQAAEDKSLPQWEVIAFPMLMDEEAFASRHPDDPRQVGEVLWPEKFSLADVLQTRSASDARTWNSVYQQRPKGEDRDAVFGTVKRFTLG